MATTTATAPRLYIGGAAIHAFDMDPETGACTPAGAAVEQDGAGSFLVPSADGRRLYALGGDGAVAFAVEPCTGALAHINTVAAGLEGEWAEQSSVGRSVSPSGTHTRHLWPKPA